MKALAIISLICMFVVPAMGEEIESEPITVQTGWTQEKAELSETWEGLSNSERQTELANLENRMSEIMPKLPENVYSPEEGKLVGYRIRLEQTYAQVVNEPTAWNYAEFAALLHEAETFVWYTEREKTLEHDCTEEFGAFDNSTQESERPVELLQGTGWDNGYVDITTVDHWTPSIAACNNYVFVGGHNSTGPIGNDTMFLWRSTDYGNTWGLWHSYGTSTADRIPLDIAIDPESLYLYDVYRYSTVSTEGNIWVRIFRDFDDPGATSFYEVEGTSDTCYQPHLSVEHEWTDHKVCCIYRNMTTDHVVIVQSSDHGQTWSTVHTTSWTYTGIPKPRGAQGASSASTDKFYFVAKKSNNSLVIFESLSGGSGTWTETEYVHGYDIDVVDISASHNHTDASVVVAFGYPYTASNYNVRILFRPEGGANFVSQLVDGDGLMKKTPVVSCDGEYAANNAGPDYYHLSYYKDHDGDNYYIPFALRCLNDSASLDNMTNTNPDNFEKVGAIAIDTLAAAEDWGRPSSYHQTDITTMWNSANNQWFPAIVWMRYYTSGDADPRFAFPDEGVGIKEKPGEEIPTGFVSLAPNPSRDLAKLSYTLKKECNVKISLYDATGRSVDNLVNEAKTAGEYTITIDTKNRSAGIYFIKVETPENTYTKQMTIIK